MDPVMLVELIGALGHPLLRRRFAGTGARCRIGRDLDSDIVVEDEHVAAEHAVLTLLEDGRVGIRDLGTKNGTRVDGKRIPADADTVVAYGDVMVGHTRLRIRTRHTPVGPERVYRRDFVRRYRTLLAIAGVSACIAYGVFRQWLDAPPAMFRGVLVAALVVLGVIALWAGVWALVTKLNFGSWHARVHVTIASIGLAFCAWGYWVAGLVAFAAQWSVLRPIGFGVAAATALVALYLHLREATHYGRVTSLALAGAVTLVIGAIVSIATLRSDDRDVNRVDLGPEVRLGAERFVPNRDIAEYLAGVDDLKLAAGRERQKSLLDAPLADAED